MSTITTDNLTHRATGDSVPAQYLVHGSAKAWANLNGTGTIALRDSLNVSSAVDEGTGEYTFNFNSSMINSEYNTALGQQRTRGARDYGFVGEYNLTTNSISIVTANATGGIVDFEGIDISIKGDLA